MKKRWNFWGTKNELAEEPPPSSIQALHDLVEKNRLAGEYGDPDIPESRINMHLHELLVTQITLNDAQYHALKEQKKVTFWMKWATHAIAAAALIQIAITLFKSP
jgi:hypothetical protein